MNRSLDSLGLPAVLASLALTLAACGGTTAAHAAADASADGTQSSADAMPGGPDGESGAPSDASSCTFCVDAGPDVPLALCPSSPPSMGSACDLPDGEECEYGPSWWLACNLVLRCQGGTWQKSGPGGPCPVEDAGGSCPATYAEAAAFDAGPGGFGNCPAPGCQYPDGYCECLTQCGGGGAPHPMLVTGIWYCAPATAQCPSPRPNLGTACESDGGSCQYGEPCGCGQQLQCTDGVWQGYPLPPCP